MELIDSVMWVLRNRPELLSLAVPILWALSERAERKSQQVVNKDLTDKLLELTGGMHEEQKETNTLLQILVGRGKRL